MPKLPIISGKNLLKLLKKHGFVEVRRKGSHVFVVDANRDFSTIIPVHGNEDLGKGLLKSILNDLNITVVELVDMLH